MAKAAAQAQSKAKNQPRLKKVYEETIRNTATDYAPWYVIPADNKWFTRLVVAATVIDALLSIDLHYPKVDKRKLEELKAARLELTDGIQAEAKKMAASG